VSVLPTNTIKIPKGLSSPPRWARSSNLGEGELVSIFPVWQFVSVNRHIVSLGPSLPGPRPFLLQCLLASIGHEPDALTIASDYFGVDADERNRATALLRHYRISDDAIAAQASQHNLPTISALERLMGNRQARRDTIVRHYQRRKRKADKLASPQSDPLNGRPAH
jgi:hypothetical protein